MVCFTLGFTSFILLMLCITGSGSHVSLFWARLCRSITHFTRAGRIRSFAPTLEVGMEIGRKKGFTKACMHTRRCLQWWDKRMKAADTKTCDSLERKNKTVSWNSIKSILPWPVMVDVGQRDLCCCIGPGWTRSTHVWNKATYDSVLARCSKFVHKYPCTHLDN